MWRTTATSIPATDNYFNRGAWTDPGPLQFGNAPKRDGDVRGFPNYSEDINIFKTFRLREPMRLRFELSMGNLFNRVVFCDPNQNWSSPAFGTVSTQCNTPRSTQVAVQARLLEPAEAGETPTSRVVGTRGLNRKYTVGVPVLCTFLLLGSVVGAVGQVDAPDALQKAATLVQQGRLDEAERQARLALGDPATRAAAYSVLGTIRFQQKRLAESVSFLQKAISLERGLLGAHLSLGQIYTLQGKTDVAARMFERVLELDPSNPNARVALARTETENREASIAFALLLGAEGLAAESIDILERLRRRAPSYEITFNLAGAYQLNNEPARALDAYDEALGLKPDSLPALRQAATIAERRGELERSLSYLIRAKKIEPDDPEILLAFGRVCLRMDLLEDAEPALLKAAAMKPDEPAYQYTLAAAKVGKRQFEAAQRLIEALVEKRPDDPQLQYALGSILYIQGHLAEAAARLRESIRLQPEQLASNYYLALVARDQGNDAEAIESLEKLVRRHPDHAASSEALGSLLMTARRYPEAESNLRTAVRLNPKSVKANYQLGLLLARMGRKEEADKQLELAKSLREEDETNSRLQLRLLDPGQ